MNKKSGFTIVELLAVVAILGILMGIVVYAAGGIIKQSRGNKADAIRVALESGINNYRAQKNEWPGVIESIADSSTESIITLTSAQADEMFRELVEASLNDSGNPYIPDCNILFVGPANAEGCNDNHSDKSASDYCGNKKCARGMDFATAYRGDDHTQEKSVSSMSFGYPGTEEGRFRRFKITYNRDADKVTLSK